VTKKLPARSPTHEDVDFGRLSSMGLELDEIAEDGAVTLRALVELAEDRGRPASHYFAAIPLATELRVDCGDKPLTVRICVGVCQRWGALDCVDHLIDKNVAIVPVECLDRCEHAPSCEIHGAHGQLVIAPATKAALDEALRELG
jgi:hypothetical protein